MGKILVSGAVLGAFFGSLFILSADAAAESPFDGRWDVLLVCPKDPTGALGYTLSFVATVKDGTLLGQNADVDKPGFLILEGKIEADGSARLRADGLTGNPNYTVNNSKTSTPYSYYVTAQFKENKGTGTRDQTRVCNFTFGKQ